MNGIHYGLEMTNNYSKCKTISEDTGLPEHKVAEVIYNYFTWCLQEVLLDGKSNTVFGVISLDKNNELQLDKKKFGMIETFLNKTDLKTIRRIVEQGNDKTIF